MKDVLLFLKKEVVLCVSAMLALGSMYWVKPDAAYLGYIDIRVQDRRGRESGGKHELGYHVRRS